MDSKEEIVRDLLAMEMADKVARNNHDFARRFPRDRYTRNIVRNLPRPSRQVAESAARLSNTDKVREILATLDEDADGVADPWELFNWMVWVEKIVHRHLMNEQWAELGRNETVKTISWPDYQFMLYPHGVRTAEDRKRARKERRRWENADANEDDKLTLHEFKYFIFPQLSPNAGAVLVPEAHDDLDENGDRMVSLDEFLAIYPDQSDLSDETAYFNDILDADKNRFVDVEELSPWVDPKGYDQAKSEVIYLMELLDKDGNKLLAPEEALGDSGRLFLTSQVTYYGEMYKLDMLRDEIFQYKGSVNLK